MQRVLFSSPLLFALPPYRAFFLAALPPSRVPIPIVRADDRIGEPCFRCDPAKVVAVVETDATTWIEL